MQNFFPDANPNFKSLSGLDSIVKSADVNIHGEQTPDRRESLKVLGAGLVGAAASSMFQLDAAEAQGRPRSLAGTPTSLAKQMRMFKQDDLSMLYDKDLQRNSSYRKNKRLVAVDRSTPHYYIDDVEFGNAITRPYASLFLQRLSESFYNEFKNRLKITSLSRSYEFQSNLRRRNPNATLPERSPHVRGAGIDISYLPMNSRQKQWMRNTLADLERAGYIEATEEIRQRTFHIMVFKNYGKYVQRRLGMNDGNFVKYYERMTGGRIY